MASQANAAMWDDLRAYAMGGATGRVTEARAQRAFRTARMVESRAAAESAQERLAQLRAQGADAQQRRAERQAERAERQARQTEAAQRRLAHEQRAAQVTARQRRLNAARGISHGLSRFAASHAPQGARNAGARLRSLPTPGGLGGVVAALLFFNLAIVPVGTSGQSRLYLLWQVLTGAEALPTPAPPPSALEQAAQNASAIGDAAASAAATVASGGLIVIPPQLIPPILAGLGQDVLGVLP